MWDQLHSETCLINLQLNAMISIHKFGTQKSQFDCGNVFQDRSDRNTQNSLWLIFKRKKNKTDTAFIPWSESVDVRYWMHIQLPIPKSICRVNLEKYAN